MYDFAIIGGGIVGLATGAALGRRYPFARILLVEKEEVGFLGVHVSLPRRIEDFPTVL